MPSPPHTFRNALLAAALAAAALTCAFPKLAWWPLAFVALVPLLFVLLHYRASFSWRQVFLISYLCGCLWFLASLWWIGYVTVGGMLVLTQLLAILMAAALTLGWWLVRRGMPAWLALPSVWMVFEALQTCFMTGFPWMLLGYALRPALPLVQIADLAGVYGVSWLVMLINVAVADVACALAARRTWRPCATSATLACAALAACALYGVWRLRLLDVPPLRSLRVAVVQANIPSLVKHDTTRDSDILQRHVLLSEAAAQEHPELIIWPETALPGYFFERRLSYRTVTRLVASLNIPLITGLARYDMLDDASLRYFNSAAIIEPSGLVSSIYDKRHLVMFGEYVPFERYLPFLKLVTPIEGSFASGALDRGIVHISRAGGTTVFKVLICFEDVFGHLARVLPDAPADVLLNLTNDGWFRSSPGPYQHAALSAFRAIEQRRPLVRATNSGVTTIIDRLGRTRAVLQRNGRSTEVHGTLIDDLPLHNGARTLYARAGNWFLWLCAALVLLQCLWTFRAPHASRPSATAAPAM